MANPRDFLFRRLLDNLEYHFHHQAGVAKDSVYVRSDKAVRVVYDFDFGWSIWDEADPRHPRSLVGRAWDTPVRDQGDHPPKGIWVSRKGDKSYVYMLEHLE